MFLGKGGSSIQKLRADHPRTIIQVPDCASPERVLIISGEHDQCFDALQQIIPALTDSSRLSSFNRRRNINTGGGNMDRKFDYLFIKSIVELLLVKVDNMLKNYDRHIILI